MNFSIQQTSPFFVSTEQQWQDLCVKLGVKQQVDTLDALPVVAVGVKIGPLSGIVVIDPEELLRVVTGAPVPTQPEAKTLEGSSPTGVESVTTSPEIVELARQVAVIRQNLPAVIGRLLAHSFIMTERNIIDEAELTKVYAAHEGIADRLVAEMFDPIQQPEST